MTGHILANAGTPLMWASMCHGLIGNALIGLFEAWLIARVFRLPLRRLLILSMMAANYVSMLSGIVLLGVHSMRLDHTLAAHVTIHNVYRYELLVLFATYAFTVLIEWPFVYAGLGSARSFARSLKANLVAQTASYAVLLVGYAFLSQASLSPLGPVRVADSTDFAKTRSAWVYYTALRDGDVWRVRPDGSGREHVLHIVPGGEPLRLFARKRIENDGWDLNIEFVDDRRFPRLLAPRYFTTVAAAAEPIQSQAFVARALDDTAIPDPNLDYLVVEDSPPDFPYGPPAILDQNISSAWTVRTGWWAAQGLFAENTSQRTRLRVAVDSPLLSSWFPRYAVLLPGDQVLFQLGRQIVLLDLNERRIGLLALGTGLIVVPDSEPIPAPTAPTDSASDHPGQSAWPATQPR